MSSAREEDLDEMAELWARIAPSRQFAPVMGAETLRDWLRRTPGLHVYDYLVARRPNGRIAGFIALRDQRAFKQLRVLHYSPRLAAAWHLVNAVAAVAPIPRLPGAGSVLPSLSTIHLCVAPGEPAVLRALLRHAHEERRGSRYLFFTLSLDRRDPLARALTGLFAQPTAVRAFVTTPAGRWRGAPVQGRPLHFESALL